MSNVAERVKIIVAEQLGINEAEVVENTSIFNDLDADSLDTAQLIKSFKEEFNCKISDDDTG